MFGYFLQRDIFVSVSKFYEYKIKSEQSTFVELVFTEPIWKCAVMVDYKIVCTVAKP